MVSDQINSSSNLLHTVSTILFVQYVHSHSYMTKGERTNCTIAIHAVQHQESVHTTQGCREDEGDALFH